MSKASIVEKVLIEVEVLLIGDLKERLLKHALLDSFIAHVPIQLIDSEDRF